MKPEIIECKEVEYSIRLAMARYLGDKERIRKRALAYLVILRHCARAAHDLSEQKWTAVLNLESAARKAKKDGITCTLTKPRLDQMRTEAKKASEELANVGEKICNTLDLWQTAGAAFEDLCNFCNRDPEQVKADLGEEQIKDEPFSALTTVYNLDYKNPRDRGWIENRIDAPLTHALKEHLTWLMTHTEEGRKAAHEALNAVFPNIMENAMTLVVDEDGTRHLMDKDGEEVGIWEDEDDY